jgi:hypothetical protein
MRAHIGIKVSRPAGLGYQTTDACVPLILVGTRLSRSDAVNLGLREAILTERHVAFFLLVALDCEGELESPGTAARDRPQRVRFAEHLGLHERALTKWTERKLADRPLGILRWQPDRVGRQASWTGGPWFLDVDSSIIVPDIQEARDFIERQNVVDRARRSDPADLLAEARSLQTAGRWTESLTTVEAAVEMYRRRRWRRDSPTWFEILLALGHTRMQMGPVGLRPEVSFNVLRSASRQRLGGRHADIVRARAHHIAALVRTRMRTLPAIQAALAHLERASELLQGRRDDAATQRYWSSQAYKELIEAGLTGSTRPRGSSAILHAARVIENSRDQESMRYGESLLYANRPADSLDFLEPAVSSGRLSTPAQVIGERLTTVAHWMSGAASAATNDALEHIERRASALGFAHQVRQIRLQKRLVRDGVRSMPRR